MFISFPIDEKKRTKEKSGNYFRFEYLIINFIEAKVGWPDKTGEPCDGPAGRSVVLS